MSTKCAFCEMLKDRKENKTFIICLKYGSLFLNLHQQYKGRCLFVLNNHHENYHELESDVFGGFNEEVKIIGAVINQIFKPDLINYAILGNHIQHVHWHIIPRYKDDSNWGGPPWPSKNIELRDAEYIELVNLIKNHLLDCIDGKN